jgi:hypothetical protein
MWVRLGLVMLVFVLQSSFIGKSALTLHERYGQPISETYLVRPDIAVSATYGKSGDVCELLISPQMASSLIKSANEPAATIDFHEMTEIIDELVPLTERGKAVGTGMLNLRCLPADDCAGSMGHWEKLLIYRNAGPRGGERYATIRWQRDECISTRGNR